MTNEIINHISKFSKLGREKYMVGWNGRILQVIKRICFENETNKILWDLEIQTDHQIQARRPELVLVKKKRTCVLEDIVIPANPRVKIKENEKINKYLDIARQLKKRWGG